MLHGVFDPKPSVSISVWYPQWNKVVAVSWCGFSRGILWLKVNPCIHPNFKKLLFGMTWSKSRRKAMLKESHQRTECQNWIKMCFKLVSFKNVLFSLFNSYLFFADKLNRVLLTQSFEIIHSLLLSVWQNEVFSVTKKYLFKLCMLQAYCVVITLY